MSERFIVGGRDVPGFTWIDVERPSADEMAQLLGRFGIPAHIPVDEPRMPRPSLLEEEGFTLVTLVGAGEGQGLVQVHCLVGADWLLTIHAEPCPALDQTSRVPDDSLDALDVLAKALVTGLVGLARDLDGRVEAIEEGGTGDLVAVKRRVGDLRRVVLPQRDVLTRLGGGEGAVAGDDRSSRGLRNSAERMAQIGVEVESLREALHDAATDRQNEIVRRLTVVAAIFVPLTFITGFFGQNFGWMVDHVGSPAAFAGFGLVLPVAAVATLLLAFRRKGWF